MAVRIITDSASDIVEEMAGVDIVPMAITFGETTYHDGIDLTHDRFYELLVESDELPVTSQVTAYEWGLAFAAARKAGDDVVCVTLSSKLSGTYQSALIAADEYEGHVFVVDSLSATVGEKILVELAARLAAEGMGAAEIVAEIERRRSDVHIVGLLDTLEFLKRGGRIDALTAGVGTMLHVKPVITLSDGEVRLIGKARGSKNGRNLLTEKVEEVGGIDFEMPICLGYSGLSHKLLDKYVEDNRRHWEEYSDDPSKLPVQSLGATIGTHVGPGVIAVAFFAKDAGEAANAQPLRRAAA